MTEPDNLNEVERSALKKLKVVLGMRATVIGLKQNGDHLTIEIVSPNHFQSTATESAAAIIADDLNCSVEVQLRSSWPRS